MSDSHQLLKLPCFSSDWSDGNHSRRHLFIQHLSGTSLKNIKQPPKVVKLDSQNYLTMMLELDSPLFDSERLFGHPSFEHGYVKGDSKHIAYTQGVNKHMEGEGMKDKETTFLVKIPLGMFKFTPREISGHDSSIPIWLPEVDEDDDETGNNAFITMCDFMLPKKEPTFTEKQKMKKTRKSKSPKNRRNIVLG